MRLSNEFRLHFSWHIPTPEGVTPTYRSISTNRSDIRHRDIDYFTLAIFFLIFDVIMSQAPPPPKGLRYLEMVTGVQTPCKC